MPELTHYARARIDDRIDTRARRGKEMRYEERTTARLHDRGVGGAGCHPRARYGSSRHVHVHVYLYRDGAVRLNGAAWQRAA